MPAEQCETRTRTWLIPAVPRAPFDAPPSVALALHVPSDKPYYRREFDQTSDESYDTLYGKFQHISNYYQCYNNFQRSGRGSYNQGRGYRGSPSSFDGGYNQKGYQGSGHL